MAKHPIWSDPARADVRSLDRETAIRLLEAFNRYLISGEGDVKQLQGKENEFRLASALTVSALHRKAISSTSTGSAIVEKPTGIL